MKSMGIVVLALVAGSFFFPAESPQDKKEITLTNVSYDPTRELYKEISEKFSKVYQTKTGHPIVVNNSHGGSGAQARSVLGGLKADLVTLALASDIEILEARGFLKAGWQDRYAGHSSPHTSTI